MQSPVPVNAANTISVVIATYKRPLLLKRCVEQIHHQLDASDEIVIANDDPTTEISDRAFNIIGGAPIKIVNNSGLHGPSAARNYGIMSASNDIILFADDDDYMRSGFITSLRETLKAHPDADYGGANVLLAELLDTFEDREPPPLEIAKRVTKAKDLLFGAGCGMWFKKHHLHALGMFDVDLINTEDVDLCLRAAALKLKCYRLGAQWIVVNRGEHNEETSITKKTNDKDKIRGWWKVYLNAQRCLPFYSKIRIELLERFVRRAIKKGFLVTCLKRLFRIPHDPLFLLALLYFVLQSIDYGISNVVNRKP